MDQSLPVQAEQIFLDSIEYNDDERTDFVDRACAGNEELRAEVLALIAASAGSDDYFDKLPERLGVSELFASGDVPVLVGKAGQAFGQYTLTEALGTGGMGSVWLAVRSDGRFEGEVAVKLLSRTTGGSAAERFALEGRYLARLSHPNIARLLDAGVGPENQPYLVLEYVDGQQIAQYCNAHVVDFNGRIRLFLQVLNAVSHAHAHLIVHRDIKPSNVQVNTEGQVKLLDFGVAKLIGDDAAHGAAGLTRELGAALTPEYAAPEQLNGEPVTTATDIYSLGLMLWLLLTGKSPRDTAGVTSLAELRVMAQKAPTRLSDAVTNTPSTTELARIARERNTSSTHLLKTLRSDLDNIVRKALAVDPAERYETVADFAQDLRRYLRHEPVAAQAPTIRYRTQKFVRRHRGGVLAASVTVVALISAAGITTWQSVEARRQRDAAVYLQQRVQAANEFLTLLLDEAGPQGEPLTMVELLDHGVEVLDRQYGSEQRFVGATYYDIAQRYSGIGEISKSLELLSKAETAARAEGDADLLAATLCSTARTEYRSQPVIARRRINEALASLHQVRQASWETRISCGRAEAIVHELDNEPQAAVDMLTAIYKVYDAQPYPSAHTKGVLLNDIANMHYKMNQLDKALATSDRILELQRATGRNESLGYLIVSLNRATLLHTMGEILASFEARQALLPRIVELEKDGLAPAAFRVGYAVSLIRLARYQEALEILNSYRGVIIASGDEDMLAQIDMQIGRALSLLGRPRDALQHIDRAEEYMRRTPNVSRRTLQVAIYARALAYVALDDIAMAKALVDTELGGGELSAEMLAAAQPELLRIGAIVYLAAQENSDAEALASAYHDKALAVARGPATSADVGVALLLRARAYLAQGDSASAVADLTLAIPSLVNGIGDQHPDTIKARSLLTFAGR